MAITISESILLRERYDIFVDSYLFFPARKFPDFGHISEFDTMQSWLYLHEMDSEELSKNFQYLKE